MLGTPLVAKLWGLLVIRQSQSGGPGRIVATDLSGDAKGPLDPDKPKLRNSCWSTNCAVSQ